VVTSRKRSHGGKRPLIAHNAGGGPKLEDMLFDYPITGHFRYMPEEKRGAARYARGTTPSHKTC
jgi:hypothetical protein